MNKIKAQKRKQLKIVFRFQFSFYVAFHIHISLPFFRTLLNHAFLPQISSVFNNAFTYLGAVNCHTTLHMHSRCDSYTNYLTSYLFTFHVQPNAIILIYYYIYFKLRYQHSKKVIFVMKELQSNKAFKITQNLGLKTPIISSCITRPTPAGGVSKAQQPKFNGGPI